MGVLSQEHLGCFAVIVELSNVIFSFFFSEIARLHQDKALQICKDWSNGDQLRSPLVFMLGGIKIQFGMHKNPTSWFTVLLPFGALLTQEFRSILFCTDSHFKSMVVGYVIIVYTALLSIFLKVISVLSRHQ